MRIVLSFFPAQMFSRRPTGGGLPGCAMSGWAFARLEAGIHQARFKCLIGFSALAIFGGCVLSCPLIAGIGDTFAAASCV